MRTTAVRDKHMKLDQRKIERAKAILKVKTETETIERALELVIEKASETLKKKEIMKRILARRDRLKAVKDDVADWVMEGRKERDKLYGG